SRRCHPALHPGHPGCRADQTTGLNWEIGRVGTFCQQKSTSLAGRALDQRKRAPPPLMCSVQDTLLPS
ncbi:MAG: hypothetical protein K9N51_09775, partial [Candidatus Pacebacteria bacterium]|nr:hypothetical protein [Candidatus Paceibacterota bacterium]